METDLSKINFDFKASDIVKHSAAHVLAAAVKRIYPEVKVGIGPVTKNGFYYEFDLGNKELTEEDFELIEKNIKQIIQEDLPFKRVIVSKQEGYNLLLQLGQIFKAELVQKIPDDQVSFYKLGEEFIDLCRGPHVKSTGQIGIIKLIGAKKSHWNDDESRPKLTQISGAVFQNIVEYNDFMEAIKSSEDRDPVKISRRLGYAFGKEKAIFMTETGNKIIDSFKRSIHACFRDFNPQRAVNLIGNDDNLIDEVLDMTFSYKNRSYRSLPVVFYTETNNKDTNIFKIHDSVYKIFNETSQNLMVCGDILERLINLFTYVTKENFKVEIRTPNLESAFVTSISNLFQKKIISHNKILDKNEGDLVEIEFISTDSVGNNWVLCRLAFSDNQDKTRFYNKQNEKESTINTTITFLNESIYSYLVVEYMSNIPYEFKAVQIVCIPKSIKQYEYAVEITSQLIQKGIRVKLDLRSKSFTSKIIDAENKDIKFKFIIGPKEVMNRAVSVRLKNVEVGLIGEDEIINYIMENKEKN